MTDLPTGTDSHDKYDDMMRLADLFDRTGDEVRARARLGAEILGDDDVTDSAELSPRTWSQVEGDVRAATTGKHGLLSRSIELDADALVLRATVLTYRWIDELQEAAYKTLGSIAGRAIGYLAPEVELGGAIVSAGLIETDALDRDGIAAYLGELAENNPTLMEHVTSGGGGLLDGLQMRSVLTAGVLAGEDAGRAAAGLRAAGVATFTAEASAGLRDVAGALLGDEAPDDTDGPTGTAIDVESTPRTLEELIVALGSSAYRVRIERVSQGRYIAYLPGDDHAAPPRLRLVGGDTSAYTTAVVNAIEAAVDGEDDARVMLVGSAQGGVAAAEVAATVTSDRFTIDQVVTVGAPSAAVPRIPDGIRVLSLEDSSDPIALLGSLINASVGNRVTVVFDGAGAEGASGYVTGSRAADAADHPEILAEIKRIQELGFLAS
ncbi:hypothetical protein [Nocardioides sp.]|uniref:hypothetical protein n=1 Tax=Nocardioides sp. TaxID=35761 RepID=UPI002732D9D0|nr:hypothetical protein [Nocardioides sp.]MDP3891257.1 hypothetical protein [Nocardioides sp.]